MTHRTDPTQPNGGLDPAQDLQKARTGCRLRACWERVVRMLERAEKRIMDNFRVPPHGG